MDDADELLLTVVDVADVLDDVAIVVAVVVAAAAAAVADVLDVAVAVVAAVPAPPAAAVVVAESLLRSRDTAELWRIESTVCQLIVLTQNQKVTFSFFIFTEYSILISFFFFFYI